MRTRALPSQLPVGLRRMTWAPRWLVIPLQVPVEAHDFNHVSIRYLWVFCDANSSYVQQHTDHGIVAGNITSISDN